MSDTSCGYLVVQLYWHSHYNLLCSTRRSDRTSGLFILASGLLIRIAGHRHQVDTIPRARSIRQVVAQVSAIHTDRFTVGENSYVIPNYLRISERWPPVHLALQQKLRHGPPAGGNEQRLASVGIIKGNLLSLLSLLALLPEGCLLKVSTVLGVLRFDSIRLCMCKWGVDNMYVSKKLSLQTYYYLSKMCIYSRDDCTVNKKGKG